MLVPLARSLILVACTASSFAVLGRAPGAVTLRTREIQAEIAADRKVGREVKARPLWAQPAAS